MGRFPKLSDVQAERFARVPRRLLQMLPFGFVEASSRPLGFGAGSDFRKLVEQADGDDFAVALEELVARVEAAAEAFSETDQVSAALDAVVETIRRPLGIRSRAGADVVQFLPEGGSLAGILRSLGPSLSISPTLSLPVGRHGSTVSEMLRAA